MDISTQIVGFPVRAHKYEVTAESMPPLTPTTKPFVPEFSEYDLSQETM
jgi:hypothetical protein